MVAALGTAVLFLTGLVPAGTLALPALAGILSIAVVAEAGTKWAFSVYAAQSALSVLLTPDKEAALCFFLFFGYYPIFKAVLERRLRHWQVCMTAKLALFNAAAVLEFWASLFLLGVPADSFTVFGYYVPWLFLLLGNVAFLIYDYAVSLLVIAYYQRLHPILNKWFHMK